jgi:MiaB/RimO family radical SAM methylthiotransferase
LGAVIEALEKITGLARIRLSSVEANDVTDALLGVFARSKKLCRHLHIPIQSGDDRILKQMRRSYTRARYLALLRKIKKRIPGIGITTDVLVGFPGESEKNFSGTLDLVKKIRPLRVHVFPFSPRPGTRACALGKRPDPAVVKKRLARLSELARQCSIAYRKRFLGTCTDVLIEGRNTRKPGAWEGHSGTYMTVLVRSKQDLKNKMIRVSLETIEDDHLWGKIRRTCSNYR